jgi:RNA polymerase sigma-70 factor, ECF subfamily
MQVKEVLETTIFLLRTKNSGGPTAPNLLLFPDKATTMALSEGSQPSDLSLLTRYRNGSQDAATELYLRYAERLRGLARAQLSADLASKVDVDDIVQSVFGSFFRGVNNALYDVPAGEELWKLLLVIALHKIRNQGSYHHTAKRDTRRTTSMNAAEQSLPSRAEEDRAACAFLQLVVEETLASMSAQHRRIVELRMDGFEVAEIAEKLGRSKRTVERLLQQARVKLSASLEEGK